jgi:hypothetical protein
MRSSPWHQENTQSVMEVQAGHHRHRLLGQVVAFEFDAAHGDEVDEAGIHVGAAGAGGAAHGGHSLGWLSCWESVIRNDGRLVTHWGWMARHVRYDPVRLRTRKPCWLRMRAAL